MKIVEVHKYWYPRRGAEQYLFALCDALQMAGHEIVPFSMRHPQNVQTEWSSYFIPNLETERLNPVHIPAYLGRALWSFQAERYFGALLRETKPDLVHVHNIYTHLSPSVLLAAKREGLPIVATVHDYGMLSANYALWSGSESLFPNHLSFLDIVRSRYVKNSVLATAALEAIVRIQRAAHLYDRYIDRYVAVSEFVKEVLVAFGISEAKIEVLYPFSEFQPEQRADVPRGFLYVGALEESKGIRTLLRAFDEMEEILYVAGSGALQSEVEAHSNAVYLGAISQKEIAVQLAHVRAAIVPSLWDEPFGLTALESMLAETPLITSGHGGLREITQNGELGILVRAEDARDLRRALDFVMNHGDLARERAQRACVYAKRIADPVRHTERLLRIFEEAAVDNSR